MKKIKLIAAIAAAVSLSACSVDDGDNGSNGLNSLVKQSSEVAGANCSHGGTRIDTGLDSNRNGSLDDAEINDTQYLCADGPFQLQLLHFADVDGGRDIINNAVNFSALLNSFRSEYANTLVLSSGDNWIPGPEYNVASDDALAPVLGVADTGRAHLAYLNAMGVQASALGNHEFDLGTEAIAELISSETDDGASWPGAQFPYLSANLDFSGDANLSPLVGTNGSEYSALRNKLAASTVIEVNGERIGVVGATTPTLNNISSPENVAIAPSNSADTQALATEIQAAVDALTATGINKIVLLAHMQQLSVERALAPLLRDVDIIVAGGSNTILADSNDRLRAGDTPADTYPLAFTSASNEPVLVVNTDGDYTYLGRLVVEFDDNGRLLNTLDDRVNGVYATDDAGLQENNLASSDAIAQVQAISTALNGALAARAGNVFGSTEVYLNGERGSVRTEETNFGALTAQANLEYAQASDDSVAISIKNGGGIRAPIGFCSFPAGSTNPNDLECKAPAGIDGINREGEISQLDLEISLRFNNSLTLLTLTGAQLKEVLEHAVSASGNGATPGRFPQIAGMKFSFDTAQTAQTVDDSGDQPVVDTAGSRIRNLLVLDDNGAQAGGSSVQVVQNGTLNPAAATQNFRIVTLGFLAGGGDSFPFPNDSAANVVDLEQEGVQSGNLTFADDGTEQDALAEYLNSNFPADADANTPSFNQADTEAANDRNIQDLAKVNSDTVLD